MEGWPSQRRVGQDHMVNKTRAQRYEDRPTGARESRAATATSRLSTLKRIERKKKRDASAKE